MMARMRKTSKDKEEEVFRKAFPSLKTVRNVVNDQYWVTKAYVQGGFAKLPRSEHA